MKLLIAFPSRVALDAWRHLQGPTMGEYNEVRRRYTFADGSLIQLTVVDHQHLETLKGLYYDMVMIQEFIRPDDAEALRALIRSPMR